MNPEEHELNERLARWCWPDQNMHVGEGSIWSDGSKVEVALFTESLDVQAEHLWPKLAFLELETTPSPWRAYVRLHVGDVAMMGVSATPALACANAIDQAIRGAMP